MKKPTVLIIAGATASGKTALSMELSRRLPTEIVSADSRQIYRWMDIGTAKATVGERAEIPHHLLDLADPDEDFTAADFLHAGRRAIRRIHQRNRLPLLVGGTGLYIDALICGLVQLPGENAQLRQELLDYEAANGEGSLHRRLITVDPEAAERIAPRDLGRIVRALEVYTLTGETISEAQRRHAFQDTPYSTVCLAPDIDRESLYRRIDNRCRQMLADGLLAETEALLNRGFSRTLKSMQTIGYREAVAILAGEIGLEEGLARMQTETRRYAKRQLTWLRKNKSIIWVDSGKDFDRIVSIATRLHAE